MVLIALITTCLIAPQHSTIEGLRNAIFGRMVKLVKIGGMVFQTKVYQFLERLKDENYVELLSADSNRFQQDTLYL
jgi:hypothetical protein